MPIRLARRADVCHMTRSRMVRSRLTRSRMVRSRSLSYSAASASRFGPPVVMVTIAGRSTFTPRR